MEQITLDLIPNGSMPVLHASQYDDGRQWKVNLTENGEDYTLSNETIVLDVRKGDGCAVTCAVAFESGKKYVTLVSTEQMCAVAGSNLAELRITKDGAVIGTLNFIIEVERDPLDAGIGSQSQIHDLQHQVDECVHTAFETIGAAGLPYDNTESGLTADNVQDAIDEVNAKASGLPSDVYTKEETDALLAEKADKATLEADYYDKTEADALLADKADASALNEYYTKSETDTKLSGKADKGSTYTKSQVNTLLNDKADKTELDNYYTKSQANSLLNSKANKADVYDKDYMDGIFEQIDNAFTGVNNALATKANSADVYNKTYIDTALSAKANANAVYTKAETDAKVAGLIDDTARADDKTWSSNKIFQMFTVEDEASGAIAQFNTDLTENLLHAVAEFSASQASGTPTPSAPIPIVGVDKVNVTRTGKNLFRGYGEKTYIKSGTAYLLSSANTTGASRIRFQVFDKDNNVLSNVTALSGCNGAYYWSGNVLVRANNTTTLNDKIGFDDNRVSSIVAIDDSSTAYHYVNYTNIQLERGSTATEYEAYNGTTALINLGGTYYGGSVDAVTGKITKKVDTYTITGEETSVQILQGTNNNGYRIGILLANSTNKYSGLRSSIAENASILNAATWEVGKFCTYSGRLYITVPNDYDTVAKALTYLTGGVFEYELATPIVVYASNTAEISTINGFNQLFADTGDVAVEYLESIKSYIDNKLA